MKKLKTHKSFRINIQYIVVFFVCFFIFNGQSQILAQDKPVDLTRYTPSWIKEGFADAGASHEPWILQVRSNNKEYKSCIILSVINR